MVNASPQDDKTDGGLKAGKGDGDGKDDLTDAAKIMARDLREGDAAVFRDLKQAARLRAHDDGEDVDDSHEDTGQDAGAEDIRRDGIVLLHAHAADVVDDHDAESEARDGVHGAVALDEGGEEGAGFGRVGLRGGDRGDGRARMNERCDDEDCEEDQGKMGLMILPIQTVILPGRSEKNSTNAKKIAEKISSAMDCAPSDTIGRHAGRERTVAHLGIAKRTDRRTEDR